MARIDIGQLSQELDKVKTWLESQKLYFENAQKSVEKFQVDTLSSFQGEAGDSVRAYAKEVYQPIHMEMMKVESELRPVIDTITNEGKSRFGDNGIIDEEYIQEWSFRFNKYAHQLVDLTQDVNRDLRSVSDIIDLELLKTDELEEIHHNTKRHCQRTIEQIDEFDRETNAKIQPIQASILRLQNMVQEASSKAPSMSGYQSGSFKFSKLSKESIPDGCDGVDKYGGKSYPYMLIEGEKFYINCDEPPGLKDGYSDDFPYNSKSPELEDYIVAEKWSFMLLGGALLKNMPDGISCYAHYRENTGTDFEVDYAKAYREDKNIKNFVDMKNMRAQKAVLEYYRRTGKTDVELTSNYSQSNKYYPNTENWQKAIGSHRAYTKSKFSVNDDGSLYVKTSVHESDRYDFNKGMKDIATGTPDNENGRLAEIGWAKSFYTYGQVDFESDINSVNNLEGGVPNESSSTRTRPDREVE